MTRDVIWGFQISISDLCHALYVWTYVQSLLKVAIHGSGGATRPDLRRAVQFEGYWIARPNPGRQRGEVRPGQGQSEGATGQQSPVIAGPVNYDSMRGIGDVSLAIHSWMRPTA